MLTISNIIISMLLPGAKISCPFLRICSDLRLFTYPEKNTFYSGTHFMSVAIIRLIYMATELLFIYRLIKERLSKQIHGDHLMKSIFC